MVKLPELKSQYIWATVLIVYIFTGIQPIAAPFQMSEATENAYNFIDSLPPGSLVIIGGGGVFAFDLESSAGEIAAIKHMASKGLRLIAVPTGTEAVQFEKYCIDAAQVDEKFGGPWKYGVDYAVLPYLPGGSAALVRFLEDVHSMVSTDVRGTPISELPIFDDFHSYEDIALWTCPHWGFPTIARYVVGERDVPAISFAQAAAYTLYSVYMMIYPDKIWMTNGFLGGAQYERLVDMKGLGHAAIDSYAILSAVYVAFCVLGNITLLSSMREEEEIEA